MIEIYAKIRIENENRVWFNVKLKSINSLMAYMRNAKGIQINGTVHKKKLRFMGYFHGYKGL